MTGELGPMRPTGRSPLQASADTSCLGGTTTYDSWRFGPGDSSKPD
eukprot:CAMPEP_0172716626 /NCGR_PEP_ID=MMETSP1074-20121228/69003_1 /TAXON_ID=2916 /ORGANISM="Ceratium fusus, Strain PA161109" /LENGTH=45 /DNA_ID= /DNA_START= /DNA_END= /DNA_ORIENTATION=